MLLLSRFGRQAFWAVRDVVNFSVVGEGRGVSKERCSGFDC